MTRQLRLRKTKPSYAELAGFTNELSDAGENHAGPSALFEVAMDDQNELGPVPGDEDRDGEDQDAQYDVDVEEVDTFEPDEVNVKPTKVVHRTPTKSRTKKPTKARGRLKRRAQSLLLSVESVGPYGKCILF